MKDARFDDEKVRAFNGYCAVLEINPEPLVQKISVLELFFYALAVFVPPDFVPPAQIQARFTKILNGYREKIGTEEFDRLVGASLPPPLMQALQMRYMGPQAPEVL